MRPTVLLSVLALGILAVPAPSFAKGDHSYRSGYSYGTDSDRDHGLGWAIVTGENTNISDLDDIESIDGLKKRFGDEFLYIRDGHDRYIIEDREMMERAQRASQSVQKYGREVGEAARARAHETLAVSKLAREQAVLARRQATLTRRIADRARRGESTRALERELDAITDALEESRENMDASEGMTDHERDQLDQRQEAASDRLHRAIRDCRADLREILRDAKAKHLAKRID